MAEFSLLQSAAGGDALLLRQLLDVETGTFTYLLMDVPSAQGVLIDPVFDQHRRDLALVRELGVSLVVCLDTHPHADHVTGSWLMHAVTGSAIGLAAVARAENVTLPLASGDRVGFGGRALEVRATPGHTDACLTYVLDDASCAFTGDALLVRGCGRCDFQQGDPHALYHSIHGQIFSLPPQCRLYPGHDYAGRLTTSVAEEQAFNQRLGAGADEHDFVIQMQSLRLPYPQHMAEALPANLRSGRPCEQEGSKDFWAPVQYSFAGVPQLEPTWVSEHLGEVVVLDVRQPEELDGPNGGAIPGSVLLPLSQLQHQLGGLDPSAPTVLCCQSGSRSALATMQLSKAGFARVANLRGGLRSWRLAGCPLAD